MLISSKVFWAISVKSSTKSNTAWFFLLSLMVNISTNDHIVFGKCSWHSNNPIRGTNFAFNLINNVWDNGSNALMTINSIRENTLEWDTNALLVLNAALLTDWIVLGIFVFGENANNDLSIWLKSFYTVEKFFVAIARNSNGLINGNIFASCNINHLISKFISLFIASLMVNNSPISDIFRLKKLFAKINWIAIMLNIFNFDARKI